MALRFTRPRLAWIAVLGILLLPTVLLAWLLGTPGGARASIDYALEKSGLDITMGGVEGTLAGGIIATSVQVRADGLEATIEQLNVSATLSDLLRKKVTIDRLVVSGARLTLTGNSGASPVRDQAVQLPDAIDLPVDILVEQLDVSRGKVLASDNAELVVVSRLQGQVRLEGRHLTLSSVSVQSSFGSAEVNANATLSQPYPVEATIDTQLSVSGWPAFHSRTQLGGNLTSMTVEHVSQPYNLNVSGSVAPLEATPDIDLRLTFDPVPLTQLSGSDANFDVSPSGSVRATGPTNDLAIEALVSATVPDLGDATVALQARLSPSRLIFEPSSVRLENATANTTLRPTGIIHFNQGQLKADVSIALDALSLPLHQETLLTLRQSSIQFAGTREQYMVEARGLLDSRLQEDGSFSLRASGSPSELNLEKLVINALDGTLSASGLVQFESGVRFDVVVEGNDINPAGLDPQWPGSVSLQAAVTGSRVDEMLSLTIDTLRVDGMLRDYPVSIAADVAVQDQRLNVETFDLVSGATTLSAQGSIQDTVSLTWRVDSRDLTSLWPGLSGEIYADGQLSGPRNLPDLKAVLRGKNLGYGDYRIGQVDATVIPGTSIAQGADPTVSAIAETVDDGALKHKLLTLDGTIELAVKDVSLGAYQAESLTVNAQGAADEHSFALVLGDELGKTSLKARGALLPSRYELTLDELTLQTDAVGQWQLERSVTASLDAERAELPSACVRQASSSLCVALLRASGALDTSLQVNEVPLSLLSHWLPVGAQATGIVNGGGELRISADARSQGALNFDIEGLALESRFRNESRASTLAFGPARLSAQAQESGVLVADARLPLTTGGGFTLSATLGQGSAQGFAQRPLEGRLDIALPTVAFLADFIPQLGHAEGRLDGTINVSGALGTPQLLGELKLDDGHMAFVEPGVQAEKVTLTLTGEDNNRFSIRGSASSGGGTLELQGDARRTDAGVEANLTLKGENVQVLNTTESQVWATPDVTAAFRDNELWLTGSVQIPRAKVQVDALPQGAVRVSPDQVIVGEESSEVKDVMTYAVELDLALGDDVRLSAFGLDARLAGGLTVLERSNKPGSASGEIQLKDGKYEAYGQELSITTGNLIYAGGALDKPGIDFKAVRQPTPEIEVGIAARGTLDQPGFSVFSTPSMSESDQLAYLVLGRPLNAEATSENALITRLALSLGMQGGEALSQKLAGELGVDQVAIESQGSGELSQASLVIGKYLSPKLFVSYGIGLLEPVSTLKLEYALSSKWQLITESSSTRNSADAQYVFER